MSDRYDLESYWRPVTTSSADAQHRFDRGLIWCFANVYSSKFKLSHS